MSDDARFESYANNVENYFFMENLSEHTYFGARRGLEKAGKYIVKKTKEAIQNPPKTGVKYPQLRNRSSKAGEYPANQSGKLKRSIDYIVVNANRLYITSSKYYSQFLAFGTRKMQKRAFIGDIIDKEKENVYKTISTEINRELKRK